MRGQVFQWVPSFTDELAKIAEVGGSLRIQDAQKLIGAVAAGAAAALLLRQANRDRKMGRIMRLQDDLAQSSNNVW